MLVKASRKKAKENEKRKKEAIKEKEANLEMMRKQLELFKKYMFHHNNIQDKNPEFFEEVKKQLKEKKVL